MPLNLKTLLKYYTWMLVCFYSNYFIVELSKSVQTWLITENQGKTPAKSIGNLENGRLYILILSLSSSVNPNSSLNLEIQHPSEIKTKKKIEILKSNPERRSIFSSKIIIARWAFLPRPLELKIIILFVQFSSWRLLILLDFRLAIFTKNSQNK